MKKYIFFAILASHLPMSVYSAPMDHESESQKPSSVREEPREQNLLSLPPELRENVLEKLFGPRQDCSVEGPVDFKYVLDRDEKRSAYKNLRQTSGPLRDIIDSYQYMVPRPLPINDWIRITEKHSDKVDAVMKHHTGILIQNNEQLNLYEQLITTLPGQWMGDPYVKPDIPNILKHMTLDGTFRNIELWKYPVKTLRFNNVNVIGGAMFYNFPNLESVRTSGHFKGNLTLNNLKNWQYFW